MLFIVEIACFHSRVISGINKLKFRTPVAIEFFKILFKLYRVATQVRMHPSNIRLKCSGAAEVKFKSESDYGLPIKNICSASRSKSEKLNSYLDNGNRQKFTYKVGLLYLVLKIYGLFHFP